MPLCVNELYVSKRNVTDDVVSHYVNELVESFEMDLIRSLPFLVAS